MLNSDKQSLRMKDRHYYLVRNKGSEEIQLVYNFASFEERKGVASHDIHVIVFYDQKKWGLWGWDCGTSVIDFQQNVRFEEVLTEVSKEEVETLFNVMKEATDEAAKWIDADRKERSKFEQSGDPAPEASFEDPTTGNDSICGCRCERGKYPFFTFINEETHERICLWSDLLVHGTTSDCPFTPDGSWGEYYDIPQSVFDKACALHKELSTKFVRQYRDFVLAKTGRTIPVKEYTTEEIEEEKANLEKQQKEMRAFLYGLSQNAHK